MPTDTATATWLDSFLAHPVAAAVADGLARGKSVNVRGARGSSAALLAGAAACERGDRVLLVVAHLDEADDALDDLGCFEGLHAERFGALEVLPGSESVNLERLAERMDVVRRLAESPSAGRPEVLVAPIQALMQAVPGSEAVAAMSLSVSPGDTLSPGTLLGWLDNAGYARVDAIDQPGDYAVRGGLVEVYPIGATLEDPGARPLPQAPVRIDFFGDEVDTLTTVDPDATLGNAGVKVGRLGLVGGSAEELQKGAADEGGRCLVDLLPAGLPAVLHETAELSEQSKGYFERLTNPAGIFAPAEVFKRLVARPAAELSSFATGSAGGGALDLGASALPAFPRDAEAAVEELVDLAKEHASTTVLCGTEAEQAQLETLLRDQRQRQDEAEPPEIATAVQRLHHGFLLASPDGPPAAVVTFHELFHRHGLSRRVRRVFSGTSSDADAFLDLDVGDAVVHVDHGIAQFTGITTLRRKVGGPSEGQLRPTEYLTLEFAGGATLQVPVGQIDLIQKYVGGFEGKPPLSTLGGKKWRNQKEAAGDAVKDLARELLQVQAARRTEPGIAYPPDGPDHAAFAASFPFEETPDQLEAIAATQRDMEGPQPMDRLICGDVGFGKTEIALRAAFKAAHSGKQVAVLVPTTVLAEQHARTFTQRLKPFGFRVEALNRFKTGKEARVVLKALQAGEVRVIIGTHRLLSADVNFHDLGLVVIDEEQKFGVEHKHRLLALRLTADVLTMTATPIPRTLHMSMVGLRDISSLTTPPAGRRAVVTEVVPHRTDRTGAALQRELARGGQAYVVHNRINGLHRVAADVKADVPDAEVAIGHGQMGAHELEAVMMRFIRGEADVLVSTTIIESGIDVPNANTMIIHDADRFGLAELHQLRGRVGRSSKRAYCYLLLPPGRTVSEVAQKRLRAIEDYAVLGAGFKIAMRDLEIRGAGDLLGGEQSGHIAAVGYELYCVMLDQETRRLNHQPVVDVARCHLELPAAGNLPKRYIPAAKHRMEAYRRLTRVDSLPELDRVVDELKEAYGPPPAAAEEFIALVEIRLGAAQRGITRVKLSGPDLIFSTDPSRARSVQAAFVDAPGRVTVLDQKEVFYRPPAAYLEEVPTLLAVLRKLLVTPLRGEQPRPPARQSPPPTQGSRSAPVASR
ncbi:transcription-repair coupling factor [Phycisphaera mikurensis]|uniref:Transcription-repair-coupling factor n=1 Tax=Phycisphaera mikurensis (strain NBRC 102666 / KCTC 22515 / FYK2301M01) TaxID=1142394 RepID=I0IGV3_PHYMF|nr:transcription-repair coupling factor [Phycisphaera mikurensis]MBB6440748.1 transcription-repair coupling factor (superfamily II helicase) [Phycisphaera mikurensis]BAM04491.1 transcription-repair-coupling factor [Phycisphaera mikurensis NBRC 102666]